MSLAVPFTWVQMTDDRPRSSSVIWGADPLQGSASLTVSGPLQPTAGLNRLAQMTERPEVRSDQTAVAKPKGETAIRGASASPALSSSCATPSHPADASYRAAQTPQRVPSYCCHTTIPFPWASIATRGLKASPALEVSRRTGVAHPNPGR